ncbi:MAG TPA: PLP-dependent aminotransferase family protein [Bacteroidia bacterium]|nr:PLP-dependent aminotransferase family protein [Bacteroidia bacterium]
MFLWNSIKLKSKKGELPIYQQISNAVINAIKEGKLLPGQKIPSSRELSFLLKVHRKTIVNAYMELDAQGWIYTAETKGTFINDELPEVTPVKWNLNDVKGGPADKPGYSFKINTTIKEPGSTNRWINGFHDGPDVRLVPIEQLARTYKGIIKRPSWLHNLSYVDTAGNMDLRTVLSEELNSTRGLQTTADNIFISRGSQMAIYLLSRILLEKGDNVVVGNIGFYYADKIFTNCGCNLVRVSIDDDGMDMEELRKLCKKKKIRAVYVTAHHHYPTTVTLSASRRMELLALSEQYGFIILEDDYDYDFHYESNPILPLASSDKNGMVIYIGTLSKTIAPALRIGYVAAPKIIIKELGKFRQIVDVQGDPVLEKAVAEMYNFGEIRRHMKKALKEYRQRRDFSCNLLQEKLGDTIQFKIPEGGLAIWAKFDKKVSLPELSARLMKRGIALSNGLIHDAPGKKLNSCRMGFGWMTMEEMGNAIHEMADMIKKM